MADPTLSGSYAAREQAKREQSTPTPLPLTIIYDPDKAPQLPDPDGQGGQAPAEIPVMPPGELAGAEPAAEGQPDQDAGRLTLNEAKAAFQNLLRQFGITQPLGEKGILESTAEGVATRTTGDTRDVPDLVRRVLQGLDLGLQVATAPAVGAGTLAKEVIEQGAPLPWQAAQAAGVAVPEGFTKRQETVVSRFAQVLGEVAGGAAYGPGALAGPRAAAQRAAQSGPVTAAKGIVRETVGEQGQRGSLGVPKPPKPLPRKPTLRPATKAEAEVVKTGDASTLQVGDKLMAIKWGEMADDQAIADTVKKLRALYTEKHTIPMEETRRLADQLREAGFEDSVVSRALLDGKTRAEAQALMDISKKGIERAHELREQLRLLSTGAPNRASGIEATPEYQRVFQEFQVQVGIAGRYIQLLDDLIGEAGGTLRVAQEAAQQIGGARMDWMRSYADKVSKGLIRDVEMLPELWDALPRDEQKWQFTRLATKHGWDILRELAYDSMLFTFKGQMANLIGNTVQLKRPVDLTLASGIGTLRHALFRGERAIPFQRAVASGQGMLAALTEAHWAAWDTFLTGQSRFGDEFKSVQRAISGARVQETLAAKNITLADPISKAIDVAGFTLGVGNRALGAGDEYFKLVHYSGYSYELALEDALRQGLTGAKRQRHMRQYLRFMPDEAKREAAAYAHYATYTEPLSGTLKWMHRATDSPALVGFIPFFKTLANVMKVGFEHLPGLNFLVTRAREDFFAGGTRTDMALAKLAEGTALAVSASWFYDAGKLTGRKPTNKGAAKVLEDMGWQEDAWAFYDDEGTPTGYMSINRLDPSNQAFILVSRYKDLMADMGAESLTWDTKDEMAVALALALGEYTQNISFMRGVKDAMEIYTTSDLREASKRQSYLARRAASLLIPSGLGQITAARDPYLREASEFADLLCARTPWCSTGLYPQRKLNGEPRLRLQAIGPKWLQFASPLPYSKANPDPVSSTIVNNDMAVTFPARVILGRKPSELEPVNLLRDGIRLSDHQYDLYQRLAGNELKLPLGAVSGLIRGLGYEGELPASGDYGMWDLLTVLVQTSLYERLQPASKERVVLGLMAHYRTAAIGELYLNEKAWLGERYEPERDFRRQYLDKKLNRAEALGGPEIRREAEEALRRLPDEPDRGIRERLLPSLGR